MEQLNQKPNVTRTVNLKFGYIEKTVEEKEVAHNKVVISNKITASAFVSISDAYGNSEFQFTNELIRKSISKFGTLEMPLPVSIFLSLNQVDREKLVDEFNLFFAEISKEVKAEIVELSKVKLTSPIVKDGKNYDTVEFGYLTTGYDYIAIEKIARGEEEKQYLTLLRHISKLSISENSEVFDGDLTYSDFENIEVGDYFVLQQAQEKWLNSFRT